ncbi:uncharacterized protein LOC122251267 isoform X2 [Penaeus japonicus]|uniref:uncharacterized protein LOC122251267 isoform X2 n=1 Tax=Penaeus japonicus TaxID=27405 RepID=UPI001C70B8AB|nr:uncharacterized protein LOC122251267 isoform X2 [Penaeus japonicus]
MPTITRSGTKPFLPCGRRGQSPSNWNAGTTKATSRFDIGSKSCGTNGFRYTSEGIRQGRAQEGRIQRLRGIFFLGEFLSSRSGFGPMWRGRVPLLEFLPVTVLTNGVLQAKPPQR